MLHASLVSGRWSTLTLGEQLGNVGSDFERAIRWKQKKQLKLFSSAMARTLELIDLTLADKRWHNHRLQELTRLREEICKELFASQINNQSIHSLQSYFLSMAKLQRNNQ